MRVELGSKWEPTDKPIHFTHNFTDVRAKIDVKVNGDYFVKNNTIAKDEKDWEFGQNNVRNITDLSSKEEQLLTWIMSPKGIKQFGKDNHIDFTGHRCWGPCTEDIDEKPTEDKVRLWSDPSNWPGGRLPAAEEDVHVLSGWNMTMDLPETPIYRLVRINGILNFKDDIDIKFNAKHIFVRAGELNIGKKDKPYLKNCQIMLYGEKNAKMIVYDEAIEAGNKLIANTNKISIFGKKRKQTILRLHAPAEKGATQLTLDKDMDLVAGDRLGLLPTSYEPTAGDDVHVKEYDATTGITKIERSRPPTDTRAGLLFYHWGAEKSTEEEFAVDMRGEALLLTRNIKIVGEDIESWGA